MPTSFLASPRFALAEPGQLLQDARQGRLQRNAGMGVTPGSPAAADRVTGPVGADGQGHSWTASCRSARNPCSGHAGSSADTARGDLSG